MWFLYACTAVSTDTAQGLPDIHEADADTDADADADTDVDTDVDTDTGAALGEACDPEGDGCAEGLLCCTACCEEGTQPVCTEPDFHGTCPLPDISLDEGRLRSSLMLEDRVFEADDCGVIEGCVGAPGLRRILRFTTSTPNLGTADLILGKPEDHPDQFGWSECHFHYHFNGYAAYTIADSTGATLLTGRKQAFCLMDSEPVSTSGTPRYTCGDQGISAGWADNYDAFLDCQWMDVTDLPAGDYTLRVTLDPDHQFRESNTDNNTQDVTVSIPDPSEPPSCAP
jgi:hypothetical protein